MVDCLFCKIVAGEVPAQRVTETARTLAFRDINPQAPTHGLVIPKDHYRDLAARLEAPGVLLPGPLHRADSMGTMRPRARACTPSETRN